MPQFRVLVDADSNGSFERDLTVDVLEARWELGMAAAGDGVAAQVRVRLMEWSAAGSAVQRGGRGMSDDT